MRYLLVLLFLLLFACAKAEPAVEQPIIQQPEVILPPLPEVEISSIEIQDDDYIIRLNPTSRHFPPNTRFQEQLVIYSFAEKSRYLRTAVKGPIAAIVMLNSSSMIIPALSSRRVIISFNGSAGEYEGSLELSGDITYSLPLHATIAPYDEPFELSLATGAPSYAGGQDFTFTASAPQARFLFVLERDGSVFWTDEGEGTTIDTTVALPTTLPGTYSLHATATTATATAAATVPVVVR